MEAIDIIIILVIGAILGVTLWYVRKAKKNGKKCIGCPDNCACSHSNCNGGCTGCRQQ